MNENVTNKEAYFIKIKNNEPVSIACEGTSLTYGKGTDNLPPINGASYLRALHQYPTVLEEALQHKGIKATVINRGYPGGTARDGFVRWAKAEPTDVVIFEYASNELFQGISPAAFKKTLSSLVERRLEQKTWVIMCTSPDMVEKDSGLETLRAVNREVAHEYELPLFEIQKNIEHLGHIWTTDDVHLKAIAYKEWGLKIAHLLM